MNGHAASTVSLDSGGSSSETIGGKALNLALMLEAGFDIPPAFAVTVSAYEEHILRTGLAERIAAIVESIDFDDETSLSEGSESIREMIGSFKPSDALEKEIGEAVSRLGGKYYAVRSSAVAEDLPEASFAGQQDTFLNVSGEDVVPRMLDCWASYWNERAMKYRHDTGIPHLESGIAVVVQMMVDSEVSGVMFTSDPLDGSSNIVIESSWGLGESIASGIVTPDRFRVSRDGNIISEIIRSKERGYYLRDGRNTLVEIDASEKDLPSLSHEDIAKIKNIGIALEKHFGVPQDIEWAMESGKLYILQSRAVTTLTDDAEKDEILWTRAYGDEYWADATTPLFYSVMGKMLTDYVNHEGARVMGYNDIKDTELTKLHKSRVYFNSWVLERVFSYYPRFIRSKELLNYFPLKDQERISGYPTDVYHTVMSQILVMLRDPDGMMTRTDKAYKTWAAEFLKKCGEFDSIDLSELSDRELVDLYEDIERNSLKHYRLIRYGMVSHSIMTNLMVKNWLAKWLGDTDGKIYACLISGLPDNKTVATNIGLSELAKIVRKDESMKFRLYSSEPKEFLDWMDSTDNELTPAMDAFMNEFGHRSNTREIMAPRWREDREYVLNVVRLLSESDLDLKKMEITCHEDRELMEKTVIDRIKHTRGGYLKAKLFGKVLGLAQTYLAFRENQRFYLDHILFRQRLMILEIGRRLSGRSLIPDRNDVFFLFDDEMFGMLDGIIPENIEKHLAERKMEFHRYKSVLPPKFLKNGIDFDDTVVTEGQNAIYGAAASPGTFTGTARVIDSIKGLSTVRDGDILVTSNTDPGWTAVFSRLGALVTETGGILSHGAVISREYRIPAVTAVKNATAMIRTGQKITVDGNEGVIYIIEEET